MAVPTCYKCSSKTFTHVEEFGGPREAPSEGTEWRNDVTGVVTTIADTRVGITHDLKEITSRSTPRKASWAPAPASRSAMRSSSDITGESGYGVTSEPARATQYFTCFCLRKAHGMLADRRL